jgi:hypothetical protein
MSRPVNPHEGQVAIPSPRDPGYVIGRLGARAMVWVEQATGKPLDDIYVDVQRRIEAAMKGNTETPPVFPVSVTATVLWAAVEHERRLQGAPGPEYTVDDAYELIEHVGLDDAYSYALSLMQLSLPFRKRTEALEQAAAAAGEPSPVDPLRAAAMAAANAGTGNSSSTPHSPQG